MSKILKSKSGRENRIYIRTRGVFSCHVESVVLLSKKKATDFVEIEKSTSDNGDSIVPDYSANLNCKYNSSYCFECGHIDLIDDIDVLLSVTEMIRRVEE